MKHLTESILSKRTDIYELYELAATKDSLVRWVKEHEFEDIEWSWGLTNSSFGNENCYLLGPNMERYNDSNWLMVHNKNVFRLTFWFDKNDKVKNIEYVTKEHNKLSKVEIHEIDFKSAKKILMSMV